MKRASTTVKGIGETATSDWKPQTRQLDEPHLQAHQNSKSIENCNCLVMPGLLGVVNTGIDEFSGPRNWFRATTFVWLRRLKDSTTKSSFPCSPILKNFSTRKSNCTWLGATREFRPKPRGREDNGNAPLRLASKPVRGLIGLPLPMIRIGAASMLPSSLAITPEDFLPSSSSANGRSKVPLNTNRCR